MAVRIPALNVDAAVSPIQSDTSGALVPPSDYTTVGWWAAGARPGARHGTAIVAGHTVLTGGGAFDYLGRVRPGQRVIIQRQRGDLVYRVTSVMVYRKGQLADQAADVLAQDGPGRLALVTCDDWNGTEYLSNVVVLASPLRGSTKARRTGTSEVGRGASVRH